MWVWILIGLNIITKANGFASGDISESCESMMPKHFVRNRQLCAPQPTECPFTVNYTHGKEGEPIKVFLSSKSDAKFRGFMLAARKKDEGDEGQPVGKFIKLDQNVKLMNCGGLSDSAVGQANNVHKTFISVTWRAEGAIENIIFRATFVQTYCEFWAPVEVDVIPPQYTTSTTKPNTPSATKPSTTACTTKPSNPNTTTPSTPSTRKSSTPSTTVPGTTTSTAKPSTTTSITKPRCTKIGHLATCLTAVHGVLTMVMPHISMFIIYISQFSQRLNKGLKMCCSVLCTVVGFLALFLYSVEHNLNLSKVIALMYVVIMIDIIELACLLVTPIRKLEEKTLNVLSVISEIFTVAVIFIDVLEIHENCRRETWLLIVMFAYTVWILLFGVWVFLLSTQLRGILGRGIIGKQIKKEKLNAAKVIITALSVVFVVGDMLFAAAITVGIFRCPKK